MREQQADADRTRCAFPLIESLEPRLLLSTTGEEVAPPPETTEAATTDQGEIVIGTNDTDFVDGSDVTSGDDMIRTLGGDDVILWDGENSTGDVIDGGGDFDLLISGTGLGEDDVVDVSRTDGITNVEGVVTLEGDDEVSVVLQEILRNSSSDVFVALMGEGQDTLWIDSSGRWLDTEGSVVKDGDGGELAVVTDTDTLTGIVDAGTDTLLLLNYLVSQDGTVKVLTFTPAGGPPDSTVVIVTDAETVHVGTDEAGYITYDFSIPDPGTSDTSTA